jgi:TonB family protein
MRQLMAWMMVGVVVLSLPAKAQVDEFQPLSSWVSEPGARARVNGDILAVQKGTVRTNGVFGDSVLRFEFRLLDDGAEGYVFVHSRFGYGNSPASVIGYRVALTSRLTGSQALGRASSVGVGMKEEAFEPLRTAPLLGQWQQVQIKAERDAFEISVNGALVSSLGSVTELAGYVAFHANGGTGIEFRNIQVSAIPTAKEPFGQGAHRLSEGGIELPKLVNQSKPFYPKEPHDAGIQGAVGLEVVIEADGSVGDVRVTNPVHRDLNEAAIACVRQWRFVPGKVSGSPVPVIATIEVSFVLGAR